jgi:hypothetical protein
MTFDLARVPGGDVAAWGAECRDKALSGVRDGDWCSIYDWTKSWIGWGGGCMVPRHLDPVRRLGARCRQIPASPAG